MKIYIKSNNGEVAELEVEPSDTVGSVKSRYQALKNESFGNQKLVVYQNSGEMEVVTVLEDTKTLADYIIDGETCIFLRLTAVEKQSISSPSNCQEAQDTVQIYCNIKYGKQLTLRVSPAESVREVKTRIQGQENVRVEDQVLTVMTSDGLLSWTELEDDRQLNDYNVTNGGTVFLKSRGPYEPRSPLFTEGTREPIWVKVGSGYPHHQRYPVLKVQICDLKRKTYVKALSLCYDPASDTVGTIKTKIQNTENIPCSEQKLMMLRDGNVRMSTLNDHVLLRNLKINDENKLYLYQIRRSCLATEETTQNDVKRSSENVQMMQTYSKLKIICLADIDNETKEFNFFTYPFETIAGVKDKIQKIANVPVSEQTLMSCKISNGYFCKTPMEDALALRNYNIEDGETIYLKVTRSAVETKTLGNGTTSNDNKRLGTEEWEKKKITIYCQAKIGNIDKVIKLDVENFNTIESIKEKIKEKENISPYEQSLSSWRRDGEDLSWGVLEGGFTLLAYGIENNDIVFLKWVPLSSESASIGGSSQVENMDLTIPESPIHTVQNTMKIFYQSLIGMAKRREIHVNPSDTIWTVKTKIEMVENVPATQQSLTRQTCDGQKFAWVTMEDSPTLAEYGVQSGATVYLNRVKPGVSCAWSTYRIIKSGGPPRQPAATVKIVCKTVVGELCARMTVRSSETVRHVKKEFRTRVDLVVPQCCVHCLVLDCDYVEDSCTLADLGLGENSTLYSVVKHLGPGRCLRNTNKRRADSDYEDDVPKFSRIKY